MKIFKIGNAQARIWAKSYKCAIILKISQQMITSYEFHPYLTIFEWYIKFGDSSEKIGIFGNFRSEFSEKSARVLFSTNSRPKTKKNRRAIFEKNIKVSDFGLIWRRFQEYNIFFAKKLTNKRKSFRAVFD